ncbi:MAG: hypothetical protein K0S12_434 [Bacteroidetes bacterium]|jgi:hypothetical protein|nr:hypothetical protein [Bacteroidota bacterium]
MSFLAACSYNPKGFNFIRIVIFLLNLLISIGGILLVLLNLD